MIYQIKKLEPVIEKLLENKQSLRDNDNALYSNLIYSMDTELKGRIKR